MKKGLILLAMKVMLVILLMNAFLGVSVTNARVNASFSSDTSISRSDHAKNSNEVVNIAEGDFSVSQDGWYVLEIEMNVSSQVNIGTFYQIKIDGQDVQSIAFNSGGTTVIVDVATFLSAGSHNVSITTTDVSIVSVNATPAPTVKSSELTILNFGSNRLAVNTSFSVTFFVESTMSVKVNWGTIGSLDITAVSFDGSSVDAPESKTTFRDLAPNVPHNLTFQVNGIATLLGSPGLTIVIKTNDETPPQVTSFSHAASPIVDNKLFNVTITLTIEDDISGLLIDSVKISYVTHDSITDSWDDLNRSALFISVTTDNKTFQFVVPNLKIGIDKIIVYISALDKELNEMELERAIDISLDTETKTQSTPGLELPIVVLSLISVTTGALIIRRKQRRLQFP